jgi:hypothetical protein
VALSTNKWLLLLPFHQQVVALSITKWLLLVPFRVCARTNMFSHTCWSFKTFLILSPVS